MDLERSSLESAPPAEFGSDGSDPIFEKTGKARPDPDWGRRIAWLVSLWLAGVAGLGLVALLLRGVMRLAGLTS
jgi:hypothetical protein